MGASNLPNTPIKSVQRGVTGAAGNITLSKAVNVNKTFILSKSKGSAGTVAATGSITLTPGTNNNSIGSSSNSNPTGSGGMTFPNYSGSLTGGTTNLTVKEYSATLTNSTTINCDGPVEWQVVEYV